MIATIRARLAQSPTNSGKFLFFTMFCLGHTSRYPGAPLFLLFCRVLFEHAESNGWCLVEASNVKWSVYVLVLWLQTQAPW